MSINTNVDNYSVDVQGVYVVSHDGNTVKDIKSNILSLSIVEDIFTPFITCEVTILDFNQLADTFPLVGEEYLIINFAKDLTASGGETRQSSFTFLLYKQSQRGIGENNRFQGYVLHGISVPRASDGGTTFSQSYHASYGTMVSSIFNQYYSDVNKELFVEKTKGIHKFIVPTTTPLTAINMLRKRALSESEPYSPFLFFENQEKYYFISIDRLFRAALSKERAKIKHYYINSLLTEEDKSSITSPTIIIGPNAVNDIIAISVRNKYDTVNKIDSGAFNSVSRSFDLTTKAFTRSKFNITEKLGKFFLGNRGNSSTDTFMKRFENTSVSGPYNVVDIGTTADGQSQDYYPDAVSSMRAYTELISQEIVVVNLYGDNNFKAGDSIYLGITTIDGKTDPTLAGSHLISSVKHLITFDSQPRYIVSLECLKGSYVTNISDMPNG